MGGRQGKYIKIAGKTPLLRQNGIVCCHIFPLIFGSASCFETHRHIGHIVGIPKGKLCVLCAYVFT
jgi:hypothetical protein